MRKIAHLFVVVILLVPFLPGTQGFLVPVHIGSSVSVSSQAVCDMGSCVPHLPRCPLCPGPNFSPSYLCQESGVDLPSFISYFVRVSLDPLTDQGVIQSIFRPPTLIL
jgi:hypothetical protein